MAARPELIEGFGTQDLVRDFLATYPPSDIAPMSLDARKRIEGIHAKALDTLIEAPHTFDPGLGEEYVTVDTESIPFHAAPFSGRIALRAATSLPKKGMSEIEVTDHMKKELTPVSLMAAPAAEGVLPRRLILLYKDGIMRVYPGLHNSAGITEINARDMNYTESLIRKMRNVWGLKADNKK